jgi:hypothetical protein
LPAPGSPDDGRLLIVPSSSVSGATLEALRRTLHACRERALEIFPPLADGARAISWRDLARGLHLLGVSTTREEARALFDSVNAEGTERMGYRALMDALVPTCRPPSPPFERARSPSPPRPVSPPVRPDPDLLVLTVRYEGADLQMLMSESSLVSELKMLAVRNWPEAEGRHGIAGGGRGLEVAAAGRLLDERSTLKFNGLHSGSRLALQARPPPWSPSTRPARHHRPRSPTAAILSPPTARCLPSPVPLANQGRGQHAQSLAWARRAGWHADAGVDDV